MTAESAPDHDESERHDREVEFEQYLAREDVTAHLESFLDGFRSGETVTMTIGDETVEFEPPAHLQFEIEYEEDDDEREVEIELEWRVQDEDLEIDTTR